MRKTAVLLLGAACVALLPSIASAKSWKHHHYRHHHRVVAAPVSDNAGPRLVADALHQLIVPLEVTFAPSAPPPPRHRRYYR